MSVEELSAYVLRSLVVGIIFDLCSWCINMMPL